MKKFALATAFVSASLAAFADNNTSSQTAEAVLNVNVSNVKSITVSAGANVIIALNSTEKFTNAAGNTGVNGNEVSTIDVVSNGAYKITATLAGTGNALINTNSNATGITAIPIENIYLTVSNPRQITSGSTVPSAAYSNVKENLINSGNSLIATPPGQAGNGNAGTSGTKYDVTYTLANYADVASLATGTFAGTIVYTITDL